MANGFKLNTDGFDRILKAVENEIPLFEVTDGVSYGIFQEFTEAGHPSAVPAFESNIRTLPERIEKALKDGTPLDEVMRQLAEDIAAAWRDDVNVDSGAYRDSIHVEE